MADSTPELVAARQRLIEWLPPSHLEEHLNESPPVSKDELVAVVNRAIQLGRLELAARALVDALSDESRQGLALGAVDELEAAIAASVAPQFSKLASTHIGGVERERLNLTLRVTGPGPTEDQVEVASADEESMRIYLHRLNLESSALPMGSPLIFDLIEDADGDWSATAIRNPDGTVIAAEEDPPTRVLQTTKFAIIEAGRRLAIRSQTSSALVAWLAEDLQPREVVERALEAVKSVDEVSMLGASDARELLGSRSLRRHPDLYLQCIWVLERSAPELTESETAHLAQQLVEAAGRVEDDVALDRAATELARMRGKVPANLVDALVEGLGAVELTASLSILQHLVAPLDPARAIKLIIESLNAALSELTESSDEERDEKRKRVQVIMSTLVAVVNSAPESSQDLLGAAKYSARAPGAAAQLLVLYKNAGALDQPLASAFLRTAAPRSEAAAQAALEYALLKAPLERTSLEAVLNGVGSQLLGKPAFESQIIDLISAHKSRTPVTEQLGALAASGEVVEAEKLAPTVGIRGNLERQLFALARRGLRHDLAAARRRFRYLRAWRLRGKEARKIAVEGFAASFDAVKTPAALQIVLEAAISFFPSAGDIPNIDQLRTAGLRAVDQLAPKIDDSEIQGLVSQAMEQLRWNVSAKRRIVDRVRSALAI
jgi:hypothetical protein